MTLPNYSEGSTEAEKIFLLLAAIEEASVGRTEGVDVDDLKLREMPPEAAIELAFELRERLLLSGIPASTFDGKDIIDLRLTSAGREYLRREKAKYVYDPRMTDAEARDFVLHVLHRQRKHAPPAMSLSSLRKAGLGEDMPEADVVRAVRALQSRGLADASFDQSLGGTYHLREVSINERGIALIEEGDAGYQETKTVVNNFGNLQIGHGNTMNLNTQVFIQQCMEAVDASDAPPEEKEKAKGLLRKVIDHPLTAEAIGAFLQSAFGAVMKG